MNKLITLVLLIACNTLNAQAPLWLRYPAISPDGSTLVFNYKGDIYTVDANGGLARPLTTHQDHDFMAVWAPDGKSIAFASNRHGNYDIYSMPAEGGTAARMTFNSSGDMPSSIDHNGNVLFTSSRLDAETNSQFPSGALSELYSINAEGTLNQVLTTPAEAAVWNKDGSKLLYHDKKGYENQWRKHHTSSVTRDIWIYDPASKEHTKLTDFNGEDRNPIWTADEKSFYYLSEESGTFNVWKKEIASGKKTQITDLKDHPVRFLSMANNGTLSFSFDGELYTMKEGETPKKLSVQINHDDEYNLSQLIDVKGEVSEMALSPNGKEIAFIARGEIFVTAVDYSETKRITNTPSQERSVSFSPDGRSLLFAGERDGSWNIYRINLAREEEQLFYASTVYTEEEVVVTDKETFQPQFSPDGKEVAFLEERVVLRVINLDSKETRTVLPKKYNYSYSDGDQTYEWSPDGKWLTLQRAVTDVAVLNG
jgi:Tol biopolymer transport system component